MINVESLLIDVEYNNEVGIVELSFNIDVEYNNEVGIVELSFNIDVEYNNEVGIVELSFNIDVEYNNDDGIVDLSFINDVEYNNDVGVVEYSRRVFWNVRSDSSRTAYDFSILFCHDNVDTGTCSCMEYFGDGDSDITVLCQ
jgi:hypothetical protein